MHEYWYVAIDIFGNEIKSDVLTYRVTDLHVSSVLNMASLANCIIHNLCCPLKAPSHCVVAVKVRVGFGQLGAGIWWAQ